MASFTDQNVTQDMLPELSDNNLRELGLNIGWILRFRRAFSTLTQDNQDAQYNNKKIFRTQTFQTFTKTTKYYKTQTHRQ